MVRMAVVPILVNLLVQLEVIVVVGSLVRRLDLLYLKVFLTATSRPHLLPPLVRQLSLQPPQLVGLLLPNQLFDPLVVLVAAVRPCLVRHLRHLLQHLKLLLQQLNQHLRLPLRLLSPTCSMLLGLV
jgi:hypothetical protein